MIGPDELQELLADKRRLRRAGTRLQPVVLKRGHLETTYRQLVSGVEALEMLKMQEEVNRVRVAERSAKEAQEQLEFEQQREAKRDERRHFESWALKRRISSYGDPEISPRTLKIRVADAKERVRVMRVATALKNGMRAQ